MKPNELRPNELRLNNYILYLDEFYLVDGIKYEENAPKEKYRVAFKTIDGNGFNAKMSNWIEPIPITENWLISFGFVICDKVNKGYYILRDKYAKEYLYCCAEEWDCTVALYSELLDKPVDFILKKINFVHQLQNLYFTLTGEELELVSHELVLK